jgi:hypothetical protein
VPKRISIEPFEPPDGSTLSAEHEEVARYVEEAVRQAGDRYYDDIDLRTLGRGRKLLDADPAQASRYVLAALEQVLHWDRQADRVRDEASRGPGRIEAHDLPEWREAWSRCRQANAVLAALMRRKLPLEESDLVALLGYANGAVLLHQVPAGAIVKAAGRHVAEKGGSEPLRGTLAAFAGRLRRSHEKGLQRLATTVEGFLAPAPAAAEAVDGAEEVEAPAAVPVKAAAGSPAVMTLLKSKLGLLGEDAEVPTRAIGDDAFPLREDSPLSEEHDLVSDLIAQVAGTEHYYSPDLEKIEAGRRVLERDGIARGRIVLAAAERAMAAHLLAADPTRRDQYRARSSAWGSAEQLLRRPYTLDRDGCFDLSLFLSACWLGRSVGIDDLVTTVGRHVVDRALGEGERYALYRLRTTVIGGPPLGSPTAVVARLTALIGDRARFFLVPGEAWTDALNAAIAGMPGERQGRWTALLRHMLSATPAKPSARWLETAERLIESLGRESVASALRDWLPRVAEGRTLHIGDTDDKSDVLNDENATCLRGLIWLIPRLDGADFARLVGAVAISAYRKVPGVGPRAVKVGNACIFALGEMPGLDAVGQLALLKVRVKFGTAQKEIDKAFATSADRLHLPREEIEEMAVPAYGLTEVGRRTEKLEDYTAELLVTGTADTELRWIKPDGEQQKSIPAAVAEKYAEDVKEIKTAAKDIEKMLPAQRDRIDGLYLERKTWPVAVWRERYLDHPLVGTLARRLIWEFSVKDRPVAVAMWRNGRLVDSSDRPVEPPDGVRVSLWHPIGRSTKEVLAWRAYLERNEVTQPFKQAHREVYPLTDAERRTRVYSNRFAAHILKQHQFSALCAVRGWRNKLRLMVDDTFPPATRLLPQWGLRAEFWIEGIGDEYGADTNDSGVYLHVSTDQVRFYRIEAEENLAHASGGGYEVGQDAEPLPLLDIQPLVFSEIMRDVDLFVGVASVGNDPTWADRGTEQQVRYWQSYSFGDLSATALTRKAVLQSLVPRLKMAARCSFSDKFLVVRGSLRTYKIHLGSGNILMEPGDQYLCIVPGRGVAGGAGEKIFLPFEGDMTLSIILSKAFLLAEDGKIKDPTITQQIKSLFR